MFVNSTSIKIVDKQQYCNKYISKGISFCFVKAEIIFIFHKKTFKISHKKIQIASNTNE